MTDLVEYLLAHGRAGSNKFRYDVITMKMVMPPGFILNYTLAPPGNAYACVKFSETFSGEIVPGAFTCESRNAGMARFLGEIGSELCGFLQDTWVEVTNSQLSYTILANVSGMNQIFGIRMEFLVFDTDENYSEARKIIDNWNLPKAMRGVN